MQNDLNLQKATMVLVNTLGWPVVRHVHVQRSVVEDKRTSGGDVSLVLQHVPKGKRKPVATKFSKSSGSQIAVYAGWHEVKEPSEFTIFEDGLLETMTSQIPAAPVFKLA